MVSFTTVSIGAVVACLAIMQPCTAPPAIGLVASAGSAIAGAIHHRQENEVAGALAKYPACVKCVKGEGVPKATLKISRTQKTLHVTGVDKACADEMRKYHAGATAEDKKMGHVKVLSDTAFDMTGLDPSIVAFFEKGTPKAKGKGPAPKTGKGKTN